MSTKVLYVVSAEIIAKEGSEMWGQAKGGYLYCIVRSVDAREAIQMCCSALEDDRYEVALIEDVIQSETMDWAEEEQNSSTLWETLQEYKLNPDDEVWYSTIYTHNED